MVVSVVIVVVLTGAAHVGDVVCAVGGWGVVEVMVVGVVPAVRCFLFGLGTVWVVSPPGA